MSDKLGVVKSSTGLYFDFKTKKFTSDSFTSTIGDEYAPMTKDDEYAVYFNRGISYLSETKCYLNLDTGDVHNDNEDFTLLAPSIITNTGDYPEPLIIKIPNVIPLSNDYTLLYLNGLYYVVDGFCEKSTDSLYSISYRGENWLVGWSVRTYRVALYLPKKLIYLRSLWWVDNTRSIPNYKCPLPGHDKFQYCALYRIENDDLSSKKPIEYVIICNDTIKLMDAPPVGKLTKSAR